MNQVSKQTTEFFDSTAWVYASYEVCKREQISPQQTRACPQLED